MALSIRALLLLALIPFSTGCFYNLIHPLPKGVSYLGEVRPSEEVRFLRDLTWVTTEGTREVEQQIFDEILDIIARAERLVVVDMFLYNDFQGTEPETTRALSEELTEALIARKTERPDIEMVVISDPVNTVYGGVKSKHFEALKEAGISVVLTRLDKLRDSNPGYSGFWRLLARPFGVREGGALPSPFSDEKISMLSYLSLLNFKANHRKSLVADRGDGWVGLVSSANPHDGSSAHGNVAVRFSGAAALDLLETERAVLAFSKGPEIKTETGTRSSAEEHVDRGADPVGEVSVQVVTEGKIRETLLTALKHAKPGDRVDVAIFYISDHGVVDALVEARKRGVRVRALLDPNKDAFGMEKNGVPNRPVAADLRDGDVEVRWCDTHGEQCHAKMLAVHRQKGKSFALLGSANFTRRNLKDFNLETSVALRGPSEAAPLREIREYFDLVWNNDDDRGFSVDYEVYADEALRKKFLYELEERTGLSTF